MAREAFDADRLILEAATGARTLTEDELRHILEHVARVGFDPNARERARGALAGIDWQGKRLTGTDLLSPEERHYIRHVVQRLEWPIGTTLPDYSRSIREVILDLRSGIFTARYQGAWQLGIVRESGQVRGPGGGDWILVEYRVATGHWTTAYQLKQSLEEELVQPYWSDVRWLCEPMTA